MYLLIAFWSAGEWGLAQDIRIDHVVYAVTDLGHTTAQFEGRGFIIKEGTLHANGLLNAHIKFRNDCGLELMTLVKEPADDLARQYQSLMKSGPVGAYLALTGREEDEIISQLQEAGIAYDRTRGRLWSYITFPAESELAHVFFILYHTELSTARRFTEHANGFEYLGDVVIEGEEGVLRLFRALGFGDPQMVEDEAYGRASRFSTETGTITVVPVRDLGARPRVLALTVQNVARTELLDIPME